MSLQRPAAKSHTSISVHIKRTHIKQKCKLQWENRRFPGDWGGARSLEDEHLPVCAFTLSPGNEVAACVVLDFLILTRTSFTQRSDEWGQDPRYVPTITAYLPVANKFQLTVLHTEGWSQPGVASSWPWYWPGNFKSMEEIEVTQILLALKYLLLVYDKYW